MKANSKKAANDLADTNASLCRAYANKARQTLHGRWMNKSAQEWEAEAAAHEAKKS